MLYPKWEVRYIIVKHICLVFLLLLALRQDLKSYKISNSIILIGYLVSLLFFLQEYKWTSMHKWAGSIIIPILILFPLYFIKALGAGDIKLFSVIGSFFGTSFVIHFMALSFVIGGILSAVQLIRYKNLKIRLLFFLSYIRKLYSMTANHNGADFDFKYYDKNKDSTHGVIHFSAAIFLAFILKLIYTILIKY